ncbi:MULTISPECIES: hypothetical protein [unclassified Enterococcus]|uniref:hypothetical protein n=1 Tax=unclassified Enterococcus TaxID=2608891 RepID=UPI0013EC583D|nr:MULTISPECIES: hypothetical protein [unclassified Enterococcus]
MPIEKVTDTQRTTDKQQKKVFIFDITFSFIATEGLLQTQYLERKLSKFFEQEQKNITVEVYNSNQVDKKAADADIILLTPSFAYAKEEIEKKFPMIPVILITKKEYGTTDSRSLSHKIEKRL